MLSSLKSFAVMLALGTLCLLPAPLAAQTLASLPNGNSSPRVYQEPAKPIKAWVEFCQRNPSECAFDKSEPEQIALTSKTWKLIESVNRKVNNTVEPVTDMELYGVADYWDLPYDGKGDCEDIQLLKRHILIEKGLPARAMRMTVVVDEMGEGHAVLTIVTDRGDFVLDNKTSVVKAWDETPYTFVKRESQLDQSAWVSLGGANASPVTTANQ